MRMGNGWDGCYLSQVRITDCDHLSFILIISYHTFSKDVKGLSKQNVIGGIANNMYLHIEGNVANVAGYVSC
jgi:hypothetical protein